MQKALASVISLILLLAPLANSWADCCPADEQGAVAPMQQMEGQASPCHQESEKQATPERLSDVSHCQHGGDCCSMVFLALPTLHFAGAPAERVIYSVNKPTDLQQVDLAGLLRPFCMS